MAGAHVRVAQGQHRASPEVQHRLIVLIRRADPQHDEPGGRCALARPILLERHHLGARAQRVPQEHRALEHQPAVEEVAAHALGRPCGLADSDVADQVGVRQQPVAAGHEATQRLVQRQPQPVAGDRLVQSGMAGTERERWSVVEDLPDREILEPRPTHPHPRRRSCHGHAPAIGAGAPGNSAARARATTPSACLRRASSIISPSNITAPRPASASACCSAATMPRARSTSSGVGENVALSVSS